MEFCPIQNRFSTRVAVRPLPPGKARERLLVWRDMAQARRHPRIDMAEHSERALDGAQLRGTIRQVEPSRSRGGKRLAVKA